MKTLWITRGQLLNLNENVLTVKVEAEEQLLKLACAAKENALKFNIIDTVVNEYERRSTQKSCGARCRSGGSAISPTWDAPPPLGAARGPGLPSGSGAPLGVRGSARGPLVPQGRSGRTYRDGRAAASGSAAGSPGAAGLGGAGGERLLPGPRSRSRRRLAHPPAGPRSQITSHSAETVPRDLFPSQRSTAFGRKLNNAQQLKSSVSEQRMSSWVLSDFQGGLARQSVITLSKAEMFVEKCSRICNSRRQPRPVCRSVPLDFQSRC
ncbi:uncharacterized protein LOC131575540 [Poecile atricapillus]|uniref:uncharacterized protein LOC131575540 n=1 Tax=Poecile atricapillus TaxID=48891 RepID=UPI00273A1437|nr:uncharacterized protein LOC131575540 [Poecile atricapillus]